MSRCLVCGGRGGWWSMVDRSTPAQNGGVDTVRTTCKHCKGSGWEPDPSPSLVRLCAPYQDLDGFTPEEPAQ